MKLEQIQQLLNHLGYPDDPSTTVLLESAGGLMRNMLGAYSSLTDKHYAASFQSNGIVFLTESLTGKLTGASHFLDYKDISNVTITKTKFMNGRLIGNADKMQVFDNDGGKATYICYNYFLGQRFWKQNIENIKAVVAAWPPMTERTAKQEVDPAKDEQAPQSDQSIPDQLREYKQLADDGIITQEDFNAKKKELLNL